MKNEKRAGDGAYSHRPRVNNALFVLLTPKIVNSCQEDQRPSGAGYFGGAEAPVANPGSWQTLLTTAFYDSTIAG